MKRLFLFTIIIVFSFLVVANAQEKTQIKETESRVIELENFHEVMYPIWHMEYPEKDYTALRGHIEEVSKLADQIYNAKLPGILRDKKEKWGKGIDAFKSSVNEYSIQVNKSDNNKLLKSVENLHSRYENLVRIIRPVLKEVDQFHQILYVIYHTHLPGNDFEKIKDLSNRLVQTSEAITKATLPSKLSGKEKEFREAANSLLIATKELHSNKETIDNKLVAASIENIHTKYQKLEEIF
jgi:hypothetical protein